MLYRVYKVTQSYGTCYQENIELVNAPDEDTAIALYKDVRTCRGRTVIKAKPVTEYGIIATFNHSLFIGGKEIKQI